MLSGEINKKRAGDQKSHVVRLEGTVSCLMAMLDMVSTVVIPLASDSMRISWQSPVRSDEKNTEISHSFLLLNAMEMPIQQILSKTPLSAMCDIIRPVHHLLRTPKICSSAANEHADADDKIPAWSCS